MRNFYHATMAWWAVIRVFILILVFRLSWRILSGRAINRINSRVERLLMVGEYHTDLIY